MANDAYSQQALGADTNFQLRVRNALSSVAWEVLNEPETTNGHAQRAAYARSVINNVQFNAVAIAPWLVTRPNLMAFETSFSFSANAVTTAAGDADIQSQLMTDWDELSGVTATP